MHGRNLVDDRFQPRQLAFEIGMVRLFDMARQIGEARTRPVPLRRRVAFLDANKIVNTMLASMPLSAQAFRERLLAAATVVDTKLLEHVAYRG